MHELNGGCHCGNITLKLGLARAPDSYEPRSCDCDFCRKHRASYISDPQGTLLVRIRNQEDSGIYRQGSGAAECLLCRNCGVLVGALYRMENALYATVNVNVIEPGTTWGAEQPVSPRKLSETDKIKRWQQLWFPGVEVVFE